jgi:hypothetical protein
VATTHWKTTTIVRIAGQHTQNTVRHAEKFQDFTKTIVKIAGEN